MSKEKQIEEMALIIGGSEIYDHEDYLEAMQKAKALYNTGYRKQSEWISVDERLPETDGKYLVARKEGLRYSISVRKFRKEVPCWYRGYCGHWERRTNGITHWMTLPEAPKMKGGAE